MTSDRQALEKKQLYFSLLAFIISFVVQIIYNHYVIICRSLPDEMGAIYLASKLAGNDWTYVMTHPAQYYGSLTAPLMYPFFKFVHDPLVLYQCLLGVAAFLRSVPAFICFYISTKYLNIEKPWFVFFLSISVCFFEPTRSSNIDNEPALILCCWLLTFLLMALAHSSSEKEVRYKSVLLAIVLSFSLLAHTRALLYSIAIFIVIISFHWLTGKSLVNYKWFLSSYFIFLFINQGIITFLTEYLYPIEEEATIANTSGGLVVSITNGINNILGQYGIQSFADLLASNIMVLFVFSGGIIIYCIWLFFFSLFEVCQKRIVLKAYTDKKSILFPLMFCVIGGGMGILGLCITWIGGAIDQHELGGNLTRGHFYLRYYSNFFGPLLMFLFAHWMQKDNTSELTNANNKKLFAFSALTFEFCALYCWSSFLFTITEGSAKANSDWFYYFAPLSFTYTPWPNAKQTLGYYLTASIMAVLVFVIILQFRKKKKYQGALLFILIFLIYQYTYSVFLWDVPFCKSDKYYQSVNGVYELQKDNRAVFDKLEKIYYLNPTYGPQYIVQFVLMDIPVISENPVNEEDAVILSSSVENIFDENIDIFQFHITALDSNEYLFIKGTKYLSLFQDTDLEFIPLADILYY